MSLLDQAIKEVQTENNLANLEHWVKLVFTRWQTLKTLKRWGEQGRVTDEHKKEVRKACKKRFLEKREKLNKKKSEIANKLKKQITEKLGEKNTNGSNDFILP